MKTDSQTNGTENSEKDSQVYGQLNFDKGQRVLGGAWKVTSTNDAGKTS